MLQLVSYSQRNSIFLPISDKRVQLYPVYGVPGVYDNAGKPFYIFCDYICKSIFASIQGHTVVGFRKDKFYKSCDIASLIGQLNPTDFSYWKKNSTSLIN